ncbi:MAG: hypothetical protein JNJ40_12550 [Bacteroidia bacterium]|nr:hypothetical protein [Bacteroidia bacterium]
MLHGITHDKKLTEQKVNYFLDYFYFFVDQVGVLDGFDMETYASLCKKILFQIENNKKTPEKYVGQYFSHPVFEDRSRIKGYTGYTKILKLRKQFFQFGEKAFDAKRAFITNDEFVNAFSKFADGLRTKMFKSSLEEIISFLKCTHQLEFHLDDLIYHTKILASSLISTRDSKKEVQAITRRIFSKQLYEYPFPRNYKRMSAETKRKYLANSNFDKQFGGIYNALMERFDAHWLMFRITDIISKNDFEFTYNQVTFINPENEKFDRVKKNLQRKGMLTDFFNGKDFLIAMVNLGQNTRNSAVKVAKKMIDSELTYFNNCLGSTGILDRKSFLYTSNFSATGGIVSMTGNKYEIGKYDIESLKNNPYSHMQGDDQIKSHFLKYEPFFVKAMHTESMSDYWHYIEVLLQNNKTSTNNNQIIGILSDILLLNADSTNKQFIREYISETLSSFQTSAKQWGLTPERQNEFNRLAYTKEGIDLAVLKSEIKHKFALDLIDMHDRPFTVNTAEQIQKHYKHVLWDAQAQRNSYLHAAVLDPVSTVSLGFIFPRLLMKFRWILLANRRKYSTLSFRDYILQLQKDATALKNNLPQK